MTNSRLRSRRRSRAAVGALVLGGDYQGLAIVRSLGRHGVPVGILDDEPSVGRHSRYAVFSERVPRLRDEDEIVGHLLEIGRRRALDGWVLFATRDEIVAALSRRRAELELTFRVPTPDWSSVERAWDKRRTYELAAELQIAHPKTWVFRDVAELDGVRENLPLILKPAIKEHFIYVTKEKAWRADTPEMLEELFRRAGEIVPAEEVMVQELVPGAGRTQFSYCAFFKDGRSVATMTVRRWRQRPLDFGRSSTFVETIDLPELAELSERFLAAIGYYGLVEMEYKLDERDGAYKLLDVNPRTWGYHSVGRRSGTDFPLLLYRDQLGETVEPARARPGVKWVRLTTDVPTAIPEILSRRMSWRAYARSLIDADVEALFERDDPLPALAEFALTPYLYRTRTPHSADGAPS